MRHFLETFRRPDVCGDPSFRAFLCGPLLAALNNARLYERESAGPVVRALRSFLVDMRGWDFDPCYDRWRGMINAFLV